MVGEQVEVVVEVEEGVSVERGMIGLVAAAAQGPVHPGKWQRSAASERTRNKKKS